ncbi:hypothetical protein PIB30_098247, partial [Stylosanthes scabra]|nr:hypothetical protein [Stylosanthes scabra]
MAWKILKKTLGAKDSWREAKNRKQGTRATSRILRATAQVTGSITKVPRSDLCDRTAHTCKRTYAWKLRKADFLLTVRPQGYRMQLH